MATAVLAPELAPNALHPHALVEGHVNLVLPVALAVWRQSPRYVELPELVSLANLGLCIAASRWAAYCAQRGYDPQRLEYFVPFAQRRMRGAVLDSLRSQDWARRSLRTTAKRLRDAGVDEGLADDALADRTGMTAEAVRSARAALAQRPVRLDIMEHYECPAEASAEQTAAERELVLTAVAQIKDLSPPCQVVLSLRYFLGMELREVARLMEITESRASHLHTEAVLAVRDALADAASVSPDAAEVA